MMTYNIQAFFFLLRAIPFSHNEFQPLAIFCLVSTLTYLFIYNTFANLTHGKKTRGLTLHHFSGGDHV